MKHSVKLGLAKKQEARSRGLSMACCWMFALGLSAQATLDSSVHRPRHSLFIEALAFEALGVNHAYTRSCFGHFKVGTRIGLSYFFAAKPYSLLIPAEACVLYGRNWHAEAALGYTVILSSYDLGRGTSWVYDSSPAVTLFLGARHEPVESGWFFRAGVTLPITMNASDDTDLEYHPARMVYPLIGLGRTFR